MTILRFKLGLTIAILLMLISMISHPPLWIGLALSQVILWSLFLVKPKH